MAFRQLTKTQWRAETYLAVSDSWAVLCAWIGLAISFTPLVYFAVMLILFRFVAMLFTSRTWFGGSALESTLIGGSLLIAQFVLGVGIYVAWNWGAVVYWFQSDALSQGNLLEQEVVSGAAIYGLYAILWVKTVMASVFYIPGATQQVLLYETGQESPEQWSSVR